MEEQRANPEALLKQIKREQEFKNCGRLRIFFGYAAGVGKTYAMLDSAHLAKKQGLDVVVGYVEPHTRPETTAMLEGLEQLPPKKIRYKNMTLNEFDLDAALKRHPQIILVDELAHTNAEGLRHIKRWGDVEELLRAGIDVYSTLNVQHLESLNDIVASITGITVSERVPDKVFDNADFVELVDIEPDDLIERLKSGRIYREGQARRALDHFFVRENLVALREIALRRTADRVSVSAEEEHNPSGGELRHGGEHILICLSSSPSNKKVIRTAARMAKSFHSEFTALFVETPRTRELKNDYRIQLGKNLKLAEQFGAKIATVYGDDVPFQIAEYAKEAGITKIVIGRSVHRRGILAVRRNLVAGLIRLAPNLDIYIIPDNLPRRKPKTVKPGFRWDRSKAGWDAFKTGLMLLICILVGFWFDELHIGKDNILMTFILGVLTVSVSTRSGVCGVVFSVLSVLCFNFLYIDPRLTLAINDPSYFITLAVMLTASLIISTLTRRVKTQAALSARQARRTGVLLETSQKLQRANNLDEIFNEASAQIHKLLDVPVVFYPVADGSLSEPRVHFAMQESQKQILVSPDEKAVAAWVFQNRTAAGISTETLPGAKAYYLPVSNQNVTFAVVGIAFVPHSQLNPFERGLLLAMLNETAFAIEKYQLNETQKRIFMEAEKERLRANLLRAISHDLRTPLTSISGNASILLSGGKIDEDTRERLYADIYDDSAWLINLVENLLSITRIDNGTLNMKLQPELVSEVIGEALSHVNRRKGEHIITVDMPDDLLMAKVDQRLIGQVIINLVDNAVKYTQPGSEIRIRTGVNQNEVIVEVTDNGLGISKEDKKHLFEMFFTANNEKGDGRRGLGLGLSLCKSIVEAHGGKIYVRDNQPHGTVIGFTLKREETAAHAENDDFSSGR